MGSVVLLCSESISGLALLRNGCPGALQEFTKNQSGEEGAVCLLNLPINVHKCSIICKNTQLECNSDANLRSCMNLVMKQNPCLFRRFSGKNIGHAVRQ